MKIKARTRSDAEIIEHDKWGVPNWRKRQGYPKDWDKLSLDQKRWEFLRRMPCYRKDWELLSQPSTRIKTKVHKISWVQPNNEKVFMSKYSMSHVVHPKQENLPPNFHFYRQSLTGGQIVYPRANLKKLSEEQIEALPWQERMPYYAEVCAKGLDKPPQDWYELRVWIEFDLAKNLDKQVDIALKNLTEAREKAKILMDGLRHSNNQGDPYDYTPKSVKEVKPRQPNQKAKKLSDDQYAITLLRIMDARNCGRNNSEIASGLEPDADEYIDTSTVSKRYKIALEMWHRL